MEQLHNLSKRHLHEESNPDFNRDVQGNARSIQKVKSSSPTKLRRQRELSNRVENADSNDQ